MSSTVYPVFQPSTELPASEGVIPVEEAKSLDRLPCRTRVRSLAYS